MKPIASDIGSAKGSNDQPDKGSGFIQEPVQIEEQLQHNCAQYEQRTDGRKTQLSRANSDLPSASGEEGEEPVGENGENEEAVDLSACTLGEEGLTLGSSSGVHCSRSGIHCSRSGMVGDSPVALEHNSRTGSLAEGELETLDRGEHLDQPDDSSGEVVHTYYEETDYEEIPHAERSVGGYSRGLYDTRKEPAPIKVSELPEYVQRGRRTGPDSLRNEFAILPGGQQEPWTVAAKPENLHKNPFPGILPYDHTRVKLAKVPEDPSSDYYNASFITDQFNKTAFIAAQGPSSATVTDFWRMVWLQKVEVIVMVTGLEDEEGKVLCCQYWPTEIQKEEVFGKISVLVESVSNSPDYQIRKFQIQNENEEAIFVNQLAFLTWPRWAAPKRTAALLSFVKSVREAHRTSQVPLLVHCSDGAGATGTFLALFCLLEDMAEENEISVYDFVRKMRKNRMGMVQTEDQYVSLYENLLEAYLIQDAELSLEELKSLEINDGRIATEFQALQSRATSYKQQDPQAGELEENEHKNRFLDKVPLDEFRPVLSSESLMSGNDYINASFADSYLKTNGFILTQSPLPTTVEDFWRLVFDHGCTRIVMLDRIDGADKSVPYYWPRGGTVQYGSMTVESLETDGNTHPHQPRKFLVSHINVKDKVPVEQVDMSSSWQHTADDVPEVSELINVLQSSDTGPVLLHCIDGCGRCGVFLAVLHGLECLHHGGTVNVYHASRVLRTTNPHAVQEMDDYTDIYKTLKQLADFIVDAN